MVKIFKLREKASKTYEIELETFERVTRTKYPFYQKVKNTGRQFALCSHCNNPIQIIGLYKKMAHTKNAYGKHSNKRIDGFDFFDPSAFASCPFFTESTPSNVNSRRDIGVYSIQILNTVIQHFDRVVRILRQDMGVNFSKKFARKILKRYLTERGYLYTRANLRNVPWMVGYLSFSQNLRYQFLLQNYSCFEELKHAIESSVLTLKVTEKGQISKTSGYETIDCCFTQHKVSTTKDDHVKESLLFMITTGTMENEDGTIGREVWQKNILFQHDKFEKYMNGDLPGYRDDKLLEIAKEELAIHIAEHPEVGEYDFDQI